MIPASIGLPGLPAYELTVTGLPGLTTGVPAYQDSKKIIKKYKQAHNNQQHTSKTKKTTKSTTINNNTTNNILLT